MRATSHLFAGLALLSGAWAKVKYLGVAIPGIDFGCDIDGSCPLDTAQFPLASHTHGDGEGQMKHFVEDSGLNTFRIPTTWQFLLNEQVGGKLDEEKIGLYDQLMQICLATGAYCMIDLHNFARYDGGIIGQGGPSDEAFADLWSQLAQKYAKEEKVMFGLMNEPHDLDVNLWAKSCQAAVTSIRKAGAKSQIILLPGTNFTNVETFVTSGSADALAAIKNPDGSKDGLILDLHKYLDINNSGSFRECTTDNVEAFKAMADWLRKNERLAIISESGASMDPSCMEKFCAQNEFIAKNSDVFIGFVGWGAGSFKYDYVLTLTPIKSGDGYEDNKLMKQCILDPFIKNAPSVTSTSTTKTTMVKTTSTKPPKSTETKTETESPDSSSTTTEEASPSSTQQIFKEGEDKNAEKEASTSKPEEDDNSGASRSRDVFTGGVIALAVFAVFHACSKSFEYPPKVKVGEYLPEIPDETELPALKEALSKGFNPNTIWLEEDVLEGLEVGDEEGESKDRMEWRCWNTPLHRSLRCFDFESARLLVQHGADVNLLNSDKTTALQQAIEPQNEGAVKFLVEHGADLDKDEDGYKVPLHLALASGNINIFRLLVDGGADLSAASHFEWSMVDLAILAQDQMALDILLLRDPELKPSPVLFNKPIDTGRLDTSAAARDLLAITTSECLLPPRELYEGLREPWEVIRSLRGLSLTITKPLGKTRLRVHCKQSRLREGGFTSVGTSLGILYASSPTNTATRTRFFRYEC
ncbi:hypothetical protein N0V84_008570 [Fusarium piperis]|uniref:Endoglucanase EG-II n=1 Tax=Fusarium piperis TaxID=1435070 RepID=A0A9W8W7X2_9HYPO|nr:hypothetical protein N0V84_008570 [Fusarium piperis]